MKLIRKLKTCLASIVLVSFATLAIASPGNYKQVKEGDPSPFDGYCFDVPATAHIIADIETKDRWCNGKIQKSLSLQKASFDLEISKLLADLEYQKTVSDKTLDALREENLKLEETALSAPNNYWYAFLASGVVVGVIATVLVVQATK